MSTILLGVIHLSVGLRVSEREELLGADLVEHNHRLMSQVRSQTLTFQMLDDLDELVAQTGNEVASTPEVAEKLRRIKEELRPPQPDELIANGHVKNHVRPSRLRMRLRLPRLRWKRTMNVEPYGM